MAAVTATFVPSGTGRPWLSFRLVIVIVDCRGSVSPTRLVGDAAIVAPVTDDTVIDPAANGWSLRLLFAASAITATNTAVRTSPTDNSIPVGE